MNVKNFLSIYAIIVLVYGLLFLIFTDKAIELYGGASSPLLTSAMKAVGSMFVPAGIMAWIARDASASYGRKAILAFIGLSSLIFAVQSIMGIASGAIGQMTYIDLIVQVLFTAGGLYFLSKEKGF